MSTLLILLHTLDPVLGSMTASKAGVILLLFMALMASAAIMVSAQNCDSNKQCADNQCCSQWGYCGCTSDYCGVGCKSQCNGCSGGGSGKTIGIDYGRLGNNLPSPSQVVSLLQRRGVKNVKIYDVGGDVLRAFANSGIDVSVALPNDQVANLANDQGAATAWVRSNIQAYGSTKIGSIGVGNEYLSNPSLDMNKLLPAMQNIQRALESLGLSHIKVSTSHAFDVIGTSYPPSAGSFQGKFTGVMRSILGFLSQKGSVFMVNIYPFFSYTYNPGQISLDYALFNPNAPTVHDGGRQYKNLFDAQLDAVISAMNRLGYGNLPVVVTESGWPSGGSALGANIGNAKTFNNNLVKHVLGNSGTPARPGVSIQTYIFALFNENLKGADSNIEAHFGLFYPNQSPVYDINLSSSSSKLATAYIDTVVSN